MQARQRASILDGHPPLLDMLALFGMPMNEVEAAMMVRWAAENKDDARLQRVVKHRGVGDAFNLPKNASLQGFSADIKVQDILDRRVDKFGFGRRAQVQRMTQFKQQRESWLEERIAAGDADAVRQWFWPHFNAVSDARKYVHRFLEQGFVQHRAPPPLSLCLSFVCHRCCGDVCRGRVRWLATSRSLDCAVHSRVDTTRANA